MNDKIESARAVALSILKPSPRDLEHGLALHADALVVEAYSLGIHAPIDPEGINNIIKRNGTAEEVSDLLTEMKVLGWARSLDRQQEFREIWEASGVDAVFQNAGEEGNNPVRLLKRFSNYSYLIEAMPDYLGKVTTPDDITKAKEAGRRAIGMAFNGVPLKGEFRSVNEELNLIPVFAKMGMRIAHLTYNRRNPLGDGCGETSNAGLSEFGRHVIHELNRCGVMVDLAHAGWQTCLDAIAESDRPMVVSHSAACALHETIRGKPDNVIRALVDKGGVMGITNVPAFLGGSQDIIAFLDHIDYVVRTFGEDAVCIGTDAAYITVAGETEHEQLLPRPPSQPRWEALWPKGTYPSPNPRGSQSLLWTNWPLFTVGLVQRGYSDETIRKIVGGNLMRVFREVWAGSELKIPGNIKTPAAVGEKATAGWAHPVQV